MKHIKNEGGQALIIFALAAIGIFGIVALAIDGSAKFSDRRHAQNAADAAALAGALAKVNGNPQWDIVALDRASENGYDDNLVSNNVEVYSPPINGYYAGNSSYVQVIITSHVNTYFARVIGINETKNTVEAVALTKEGGPLFDGASIVSLDPSPGCGNGSVNVGGSGTINLTGGGIFVNSDESCGYSQTSCSVTLNIASGGISSAGSPIDIHGCSGSGLTTDPSETQIVIPDDVYMPDEPPECNTMGTYSGGSTVTLNPGKYYSFPPVHNKDIILNSGVYCIDANIQWTGSDFNSLDGTSGVTLYITEGHDFRVNISSPIDLDPSNSGDYKGYVIILNGSEDSIQDCVINGGGDITIDGTIFAPYCDITINGNSSSGSNFNAQVIGYDIKLNGNNTINFNYDPGINAQNKRKIGLMK